MVIDTSAIVAILFGEPEVEALAGAIERVAVRLMSAASVFEAAIVESERVILVRARRDASSARR
jgi:ribonuclease VapC